MLVWVDPMAWVAMKSIWRKRRNIFRLDDLFSKYIGRLSNNVDIISCHVWRYWSLGCSRDVWRLIRQIFPPNFWRDKDHLSRGLSNSSQGYFLRSLSSRNKSFSSKKLARRSKSSRFDANQPIENVQHLQMTQMTIQTNLNVGIVFILRASEESVRSINTYLEFDWKGQMWQFSSYQLSTLHNLTQLRIDRECLVGQNVGIGSSRGPQAQRKRLYEWILFGAPPCCCIISLDKAKGLWIVSGQIVLQLSVSHVGCSAFLQPMAKCCNCLKILNRSHSQASD